MWLTIEADRILYYDFGRDVILCDRWVQRLPSAGALLVKLNDAQLATLATRMRSIAEAPGAEGVNPESNSP